MIRRGFMNMGLIQGLFVVVSPKARTRLAVHNLTILFARCQSIAHTQARLKQPAPAFAIPKKSLYNQPTTMKECDVPHGYG